MKKLMVAMVAAMAAAAALATGVSISYQGRLMDGNGRELEIDQSKPLNVAFKIYDVQTEGTALWGNSIAILPDSQGYFNVELYDGAGSPISGVPSSGLASVIATKARSSTLFIGLTVQDSTGEIAPRQKLLSVPVSAFALNADAASGNFSVAGTATLNGDVTANGNLTVKGTTKVAGMTVTGTINLNGAGARIQTPDGVDLIPRGVIVMWSGTKDNIPKGWALCDGTHDTPDLSKKFVIAAYGSRGSNDGYQPHTKGGEERVTLSIDELPAHNHGFGLGWGWSYDDVGGAQYWRLYGTDGGWQGLSTDKTGGNQSHNNMPPFYALCYIMKQ